MMLPPPAWSHRCADDLRAEEHAGHVHIQRALPVLQRVIFKARGFQRLGGSFNLVVDGRVVDQHVNTACAIRDSLGNIVDGSRVGDIQLQPQAIATEFQGQACTGVSIHIGCDHRRPCPGQGPAVLASQQACRAGHDGGLARQGERIAGSCEFPFQAFHIDRLTWLHIEMAGLAEYRLHGLASQWAVQIARVQGGFQHRQDFGVGL